MSAAIRPDAVWRVARNELFDSFRSRRVLVVGLLYLAGAVAGTLIFAWALHKVERQLAETLGVAVAPGTGSVTATLWKSDGFRHFIIGIAGDRELAKSLLATPPLALFYGWLAFAFTPALVMLTASTRVSEEVASGSVRFVLFRVSRLEWCLGKYAGQAFQLFVALLLSAVAAWVAGLCRMHFFEPLPTAAAMLVFACKAWIYGMAFLGVALAVSQWCATPNLAMALGFIAWIVLASLSAISGHHAGDGWRRIWEVLNALTPGGHRADLWWGDLVHAAPGTLYLLALSVAYLLLGYATFSRRDL
jgi:ABC-type transport system involved in multi-copper enzyme maturation permease subunit